MNLHESRLNHILLWSPRFCGRNNWAKRIHLFIKKWTSVNRIEWITIQELESPPEVIQWFKSDSPFPRFKGGFSHLNRILNHVVNHPWIAYSDRPYIGQCKIHLFWDEPVPTLDRYRKVLSTDHGIRTECTGESGGLITSSFPNGGSFNPVQKFTPMWVGTTGLKGQLLKYFACKYTYPRCSASICPLTLEWTQVKWISWWTLKVLQYFFRTCRPTCV